jgi:aromatic ring-opening dioxygenase catalytic subunit (LigB family)
VPGDVALSRQLIEYMLEDVDLAYCEEWKFDHGIMVPLHFLTPEFDLPIIPVNINCQGPPLTPLRRAWAFGRALRRAADRSDKRVAVIATGGLSHWPCTPDSGRINQAFDEQFLDRWSRNDEAALLSYTDGETYREAGQGGFEIRTFISLAAAAGGQGSVWFYAPIPIYAVGCTVAVMDVAPLAPLRVDANFALAAARA